MLPPLNLNDRIKLWFIAGAFVTMSALACWVGFDSYVPNKSPSDEAIPVVQKIYDASCVIRVEIIKEHSLFPQKWLGSGSVIDATRGLILTNWHVADDNGEIITRKYEIEFPGGQVFKGAFVCSDKSKDLALIQIVTAAPLHLTQVSFGTEPLIGQEVWVVGSPYGLEHSVSRGVISALNRTVKLRLRYDTDGRRVKKSCEQPWGVDITELKDMIQTDAPINPGNSGGGLFDSLGRLVGVVNSGVRGDGLGFAIPLPVVLQFLEDASLINISKTSDK